MAFTNDPTNNPIDRIRLIVGDTDIDYEELSDAVYQYYLDTTTSESLAAIEVLKALVAKFAKYVTEKSGGLFVKESEKYKQYKELLDLYTKDPTNSIYRVGKPFAGGISLSDMYENKHNADANLNPIRQGQFAPNFWRN